MGRLIEVEQLDHQFGSVQALDVLTCSVQEGEVFGVLGPHGAGKTTFIRILSGVLALLPLGFILFPTRIPGAAQWLSSPEGLPMIRQSVAPSRGMQLQALNDLQAWVVLTTGYMLAPFQADDAADAIYDHWGRVIRGREGTQDFRSPDLYPGAR